jgi:hypothetical protein
VAQPNAQAEPIAAAVAPCSSRENMLWEPERFSERSGGTSRSTVSKARVFTTHGTVLYVDAISGELRHGPILTSPVNAFLVSSGEYYTLRLYDASGFSYPIVCLAAYQPGSSETTPTMLELVHLGQGLVGLRAEGRFLCAEVDGRLSLSRGVCSHWESFQLSEPRSVNIFNALALLRPYDILGFRKTRIGRQGDGGYVLLDDFDTVSAIYSVGIGDEVSFDLDFATRGKEIFIFDHTVDKPPLTHPNFFFFRRGIGATNGGSASLYTLEHEMRLGHAGRSDLLLKMDVEGAEFEIFSAMSRETLQRFRQIILEIHGLSRLSDPAYRAMFVNAISNINGVFTLIHAHANNSRPICVIDGYVVADILELSYVRSDLVQRVPSKTIYPTVFDFTNWPLQPDHLLWFHPFMPVFDDGQSDNSDGFPHSLAISNRMISPFRQTHCRTGRFVARCSIWRVPTAPPDGWRRQLAHSMRRRGMRGGNRRAVCATLMTKMVSCVPHSLHSVSGPTAPSLCTTDLISTWENNVLGSRHFMLRLRWRCPNRKRMCCPWTQRCTE